MKSQVYWEIVCQPRLAQLEGSVFLHFFLYCVLSLGIYPISLSMYKGSLKVTSTRVKSHHSVAIRTRAKSHQRARDDAIHHDLHANHTGDAFHGARRVLPQK